MNSLGAFAGMSCFSQECRCEDLEEEFYYIELGFGCLVDRRGGCCVVRLLFLSRIGWVCRKDRSFCGLFWLKASVKDKERDRGSLVLRGVNASSWAG